MSMVLLIPKVVQGFKSRFPEASGNAYPYFNYDHRVVNERVNRGDMPSMYKGPDQFTDADYGSLVVYARGNINPILAKYSARVAAEDALNLAIRSFGNGMFDGKINANKFTVLVQSVMAGPGIGTSPAFRIDVTGKKKETPKEPKPLSRKTLKDIGVQPHKIPSRHTTKSPTLVRTDEGVIVKALQEDVDSGISLIRSDYLNAEMKEIEKESDPEKRFDRAAVALNHLALLAADYADRGTRGVKQYLKELKEKETPEEAFKKLLARIDKAQKERYKQSSEIQTEGGHGMPLKNAQQYAERLDKVADGLQTVNPEFAYHVDMVSDVIEGRREASTLKFDADEARYMAGRFNFNVRKREADEPFMDKYNQSNFEQVVTVKRNPVPIRMAYQRVQ